MECHATRGAKSIAMMPDTRLTVDDCPEGYVDLHFHAQYRGIVGSLGWIVGMTRPDCSFAHASLSRFVKYPGPVRVTCKLLCEFLLFAWHH